MSSSHGEVRCRPKARAGLASSQSSSSSSKEYLKDHGRTGCVSHVRTGCRVCPGRPPRRSDPERTLYPAAGFITYTKAQSSAFESIGIGEYKGCMLAQELSATSRPGGGSSDPLKEANQRLGASTTRSTHFASKGPTTRDVRHC